MKCSGASGPCGRARDVDGECLVFILFIMYIWPTQLPRLGLAGEPFSISQLGSERSLALSASLVLLFEFRSTLGSAACVITR